jgi:hypothetical protein
MFNKQLQLCSTAQFKGLKKKHLFQEAQGLVDSIEVTTCWTPVDFNVFQPITNTSIGIVNPAIQMIPMITYVWNNQPGTAIVSTLW